MVWRKVRIVNGSYPQPQNVIYLERYATVALVCLDTSGRTPKPKLIVFQQKK
jgi:hypothetical protein